ncbi:hypothetical protein BGZ73_001247 [Actinomortierella ambigua]|nr:hypothetical protein BGZ73_001247 [Actinomortierella ambigua]
MNALIAFAVWCQPHGPVTVLTTQHRRLSSFPTSTSSLRIQPTTPLLQYPESSANGLGPSILTKPSNGGHSNNSTQTNLSTDTNEPLDPSSFSSSSTNNNSIHKTAPFTQPSASTGVASLSGKASPNSASNNSVNNVMNSSSQGNQGSIRTRGTQGVSAATAPALSANAPASLAPSTASNPATTSPGLEQRKASRRSLQPSSGSSQSPVSTRPATPAMGGYPHHSPQNTGSQGGDSTCECRFSVPTGEKSLHTLDSTMDDLAYISQPSPVDSSLFAPIRMACIRAFNSEKFCGKEGAVFFGDGVNGYVLTYMFLVSDPQSRGQHVKYAIMTMMTDRVYLVASMEYLISQFKRVAANLQAMASAMAHTSRAPQSPAIRSTSFSSSHRGSIIPDNSMGPTRRGRPLPDVVGKPDIFIRLHSAFVSILSSCSQRLFERHIVGKPEPQDNHFDIERCRVRMLDSPVELSVDEAESPPPAVTIDSLRELRRVLGRQKFDRFIWNALIGNQVIVRGSETRIVSEIVLSLEDVLPKDCCTVIMNPSAYEPSYACNILGLHRSVGIPPDMDPRHFVLLDVCTSAFGHQVPTPPTSMPALSQSNGDSNDPSAATDGAKANDALSKPVYQAEWPDPEYFVPDVQGLQLDVAQIALSKDGQQPLSTSPSAPLRGPPKSMPTGVSYTSDAGFQAQRRIYHLQAGEESPQPAGLGGWSPGPLSGQSPSSNGGKNLLTSSEIKSNGGGGRSGAMTKMQQPALLVERVNEILDLKLPRQIEKRRFSILREEWISITKQFHNLYKARLASDEATVDKFLQSMKVDRRDLKEFKRHGVTDVVRVCEPTYDTTLLQKVGIKVHEYPSVVDGSTPSHNITHQWLDLVYKRFGHDPTIRPTGAIACHCVAGLGRAPLLVAIALIEGGMSAADSIQFIRSKRRGALNAKQVKYIQHYKPRKSRSKAKCIIM